MKDHVTKDLKKKAPQHFNMKILRDGTWLHEGSPINRPELVRLFSTVLKKDSAGQHWLETPVECGKIDVEDSAYVTTGLSVTGGGHEQKITITTNVGGVFEIGSDYPLMLKDGVPYVMLNKGLEARIVRSHFYELAKITLADPDDAAWRGVWSGGNFYRLGKAEE